MAKKPKRGDDAAEGQASKAKKKAGGGMLWIMLGGGAVVALLACCGCGVGGFFLLPPTLVPPARGGNPILGKWEPVVAGDHPHMEFSRNGQAKFSRNQQPFVYEISGTDPMIVKLQRPEGGDVFKDMKSARVTFAGDRMTWLPDGGQAIPRPIQFKRVN